MKSLYKASLVVEREDAEELSLVLEPSAIGSRAKAKVERKGNTIIIDVYAKDASALRAALNNYLRILQATEKIRGIE